MANLDLTKYGITNVKEIIHNPSYETLFKDETDPSLEGFDKGVVTELGAGYTYRWTPDGDVATPDSSATTATPPESTTYTVTVTDRYGCTKDDTVFVRVNPVNCGNPFVFIPNSFTPNGDGVNDIVFVRSDILAELHFVIYNRWGEKIFETDSQDTGWDGTFKGKECQRGAYDYYLKALA